MNTERIGISTGTFMDISSPLREGGKILAAKLSGEIYAPEIERTERAAKKLGLGIELIYRVGSENCLPKLKTLSPKVLQIHGPIHRSAIDAILQGQNEYRDNSPVTALKYALFSFFIARFMLGTVKDDMPRVINLVLELGVDRVVVHPWAAQYITRRSSNFPIGIEPDFRRLKESKYFIWETEEVISIANRLGAGIVLDVSHTVISTNSLESISKTYEKYKKAPGGVIAIHFSVAIPGDTREEILLKGTGAMPLYPDTPDSVKGYLKEFYQQVSNDTNFKGPLILEIWSFPKGGKFDQRIKAVEDTLNILEGSRDLPRSTSLPKEPTHQPI